MDRFIKTEELFRISSMTPNLPVKMSMVFPERNSSESISRGDTSKSQTNVMPLV